MIGGGGIGVAVMLVVGVPLVRVVVLPVSVVAMVMLPMAMLPVGMVVPAVVPVPIQIGMDVEPVAPRVTVRDEPHPGLRHRDGEADGDEGDDARRHDGSGALRTQPDRPLDIRWPLRRRMYRPTCRPGWARTGVRCAAADQWSW